MRSPPMRHASLQIDDAAKPTERSEQRRSSSTQRIPRYVTDDLETIDLKAQYETVSIDRDRRLRLLIRRYVNQIQYGCQNRNCAVPTCLSYRKRNSKGPLRSYTSLSARVLACHLVEEYSQAGQDPSNGLCQSQPIIAWYRDPAAQGQRRHRTSTRYDSTTNGHVPEPEHPQRRSIAAGDSGFPAFDPDKIAYQRPKRESGTFDRAGVQSPHAEVSGTEEAKEEDNVVEIREEDVEHVDGEPNAPLSLRQDDSAVPPTEKKDLSSFVQSLWDTLPLRLLSQRSPLQIHNAAITAPVHSQPRIADVDRQFGVLDNLSEREITTTSFDGLGLRRLSWKTLSWLASVQYCYPWHDSTSLSGFLKDSLCANLSNPARLYTSAQSWNNDSDADGDDEEEDPDTGIKFEGQQNFEPLSSVFSRRVHTQRSPEGQRFNIGRSLDAFHMLTSLSSGTSLVYNALHGALQNCYTIGLPRRPKGNQPQGLKSLNRSGGGLQKIEAAEEAVQQPLGKAQVAEIFLTALMAGLGPLLSGKLIWGEFRISDKSDDATIELNHVMATVANLRNDGRAYPTLVYGMPTPGRHHGRIRRLVIAMVDHLEDWHLLRLITSLTDCISHHLAATAVRRTQMSPMISTKFQRNVLEIMLDRLCDGLVSVNSGYELGVAQAVGFGTIELAKSIIMKQWNREPVVKRTGAVGGALELLAAVYRRNHTFDVPHSLFNMPFIARTFDEMDMPVQWQSFQPNEKEVHILSFAFLFEPWTLVKYFRSVNVNAMRRAHESAAAYTSDARQFLGNHVIPVYGGQEVLGAMRPHMAKYLVLTIRRSNVLDDALNQLWRRQRREILRPLRVRLGKDEGEDGLDHGGVQQEFFRLVFAQAFQAEYGMFTVDETTRMTWFQPGSLEPLYMFEAIGILMSLAVYNAVTLPVTFPLAFYRKLLRLKVKKLEQIKDGWPVLSKGLKTLLDFDGDVAETISRTYEFSYEFSGSTVIVDMEKHGRDDPWPPIERPSRKGKEKAKSTTFELPVDLAMTPPSQSPAIAPLSGTSSLKGITTPLSLESEVDEDAATVTNETRDQYVKDYVFWLTDKSIRPQFEAFYKGFLTCLDPTALSIFTPEALRDVMEGHRDIDIDELESTATYEEYEKGSGYMLDFWQVVRSFSTDQHRQLLEFVTASDRVPVNGLESIQFIVQKNGDDDARLPSSSTCYGRLLLPEYSSRAILEEKLTKALENSLGFGSL